MHTAKYDFVDQYSLVCFNDCNLINNEMIIFNYLFNEMINIRKK